MKTTLFNSFPDTQVKKDLFLSIFIGGISLVFGLIRFSVPEFEGVQSDLRELPLIIGVIHLSNPLWVILMSLISSIITLPNDLYFTSFFIHSVALFILWYFFKQLKGKHRSGFGNVLLSFVIVILYFTLLLLPLFLITTGVSDPAQGISFIQDYPELVASVQIEIFATAVAVSIYYVQYILRIELEQHKQNLERLVDERTKNLHEALKELKLTQNHLVQSEKMASLGTLTSGIAHEINNPLNYIQGGINMIKKVKPEMEDKISATSTGELELGLNIIKEGVTRTQNIINSLMTFSRKGSSKLEDHDIHDIIDNTLLFMSSIIHGDIIIEKEYGLKEKVPVYAEKMHQVFLNLMNNALFELNHVTGNDKKIWIRTLSSDGHAMIHIKNTGRQLDPETLKQIFDPFFTTKDPDQGKGLGLSICYSIIKDHSGRIFAENMENGVQIRIELPLQKKN